MIKMKFNVICVFLILMSQKLSFSKTIESNDTFLNEMTIDELNNYFGASVDHIKRNYRYELIGVPWMLWNRTNHVISWKTKIFGDTIVMFLKKKENISIGNVMIDEFYSYNVNERRDCQYISVDDVSIVSLSNCNDKEIVSRLNLKI